jgi:hypothetical protein
MGLPEDGVTMKRAMSLASAAFALGLLGFAAVADAGLISYMSDGVDLVYDDDIGAHGLTWTANANLAASETFGLLIGIELGTHPDDPSGTQGLINDAGLMNWPGALFWIDAMNAANYGGANDWRLWSALNSDGSGPCGPSVNCTDSELGHLFYVEGGLSAFDAINDSIALTSVFTNIQEFRYWSGTEFSASVVWNFDTQVGDQHFDYKFSTGLGYVWAVRSGQVAAAPLPGTVLLLALGLPLLGVARQA